MTFEDVKNDVQDYLCSERQRRKNYDKWMKALRSKPEHKSQFRSNNGAASTLALFG